MNTREVVIVSACRAIDEGKFKDEIVPVTLKTRKGEVVIDTDEHPIGCTALRIIVSMIYEMQRENYRIGCASLCVGGGPAMASVWSREAA